MPQHKNIIQKFYSQIESSGFSDSEKAQVFRELGCKLGLENHLRPECVAAIFEINGVPQKAPEIYKDRANKDETALEFIKRVYKPWLNKGLSHNQLNHIDTSAYYAYRNYTKYHAIDSTVLLPDQTTQIDREYELLKQFEGAEAEVLSELKVLRRIFHFLDSRGKSDD